jgi:signal transduction histidine kinase/DNA-binding response OmpR family regulator
VIDRAELVSAAFELVPDGLLIFDDSGRWIEANREAYRLLAGAGRPLDELIGGLEGFLLDGSASGSFDTARGRVEFTATAAIAGGANMLVLRQAAQNWVESRLVTTINRELRTPLNGVVGVSRLLEGTNLDARQREYVHALCLSADALVGVIDGIIDFSGVEGAGIGRAPEPFDLRTVVEEVCAVGALGAAGAELELFSHVDPELPGVVHGDERRVRQVLMTLVGNAVKFTPHGEVVVEACLSEGGDGGAMVRFRVLDTGIGVEARGRESLFEGPDGAEEEPAGPAGEVGLGLAVARRLVAIMGGELGVERTPGEGTAFWFELPLSVDVADPPRAPPSGLEDVRVLVVDARPARARLLARQLEAWGSVVAAEGSGDAALAALRSALDAGSPYDLVIGGRDLDGGAELARAIAADPVLVGLRTVLVAAPGEAAAPGVDAVVTAPVGRRRMHADLVRVLAAAPADPATVAPSRVAGGRVLVAEDSVVNQLVAVHLLEERGFHVDVAPNGVEALALHAERSYEAIFMDCEMPKLDGYETTREIRRREGEQRHTPIIAMTASTLPDERERAIAAGMDYHTGKPIRPAGLDYIIAQAVRGVRVPA